jgi:hypothetical protein
MTDWTSWFRAQLQASADGLAWGVEQLHPEYHFALPPEPDYLGTWEPARHLWHITEYERCLVIPTMRQWLGGPLPPEDAWPDDDASWALARAQPIEHHLAAFRAVRQEQLQLLHALAAVDWTPPHLTLWGDKPLAWIVTKTFQHTYEHGDTIMRMGLWWQQIAAQIAACQGVE